jgi:ABC-type proline/glycine betaine transport system permease subunit
MNPALLFGAMLNSALYLIAVFVAGIVTGHDGAWQLAIFALGLTYVSYTVSLWIPAFPESFLVRALHVVSALLSIVIGLFAGLALLA